MDAQRFFSVAYDSRNHPKVDMLRSLQGGIVAYGRFIALLGILYDLGNEVDLSDGADGIDPIKADYLMRQLEFGSLEELESFADDLARVGLIDADSWHGEGSIKSDGVARELAYRAARASAGRKSGEARRSKTELRRKMEQRD